MQGCKCWMANWIGIPFKWEQINTKCYIIILIWIYDLIIFQYYGVSIGFHIFRTQFESGWKKTHAHTLAGCKNIIGDCIINCCLNWPIPPVWTQCFKYLIRWNNRHSWLYLICRNWLIEYLATIHLFVNSFNHWAENLKRKAISRWYLVYGRNIVARNQKRSLLINNQIVSSVNVRLNLARVQSNYIFERTSLGDPSNIEYLYQLKLSKSGRKCRLQFIIN